MMLKEAGKIFLFMLFILVPLVSIVIGVTAVAVNLGWIAGVIASIIGLFAFCLVMSAVDKLPT